MTDDLQINLNLTIPAAEFSVQFVRSPGPGGQNVNKLNTKAVVHWPVYQSTALSEVVKHRLMVAQRNRINNNGELVISSHDDRSQSRNLEHCMERIRAMVIAALTPPKKRKPTSVPRSAKRKRLKNKRENSEKKQRRREQNWREE